MSLQFISNFIQRKLAFLPLERAINLSFRYFFFYMATQKSVGVCDVSPGDRSHLMCRYNIKLEKFRLNQLAQNDNEHRLSPRGLYL